ncbi:MAG TPA: hypothetical protein VH083_02995, partial [Myxococcales bacterium]|nr:hypothetical protein [Myxococcales bacterium]
MLHSWEALGGGGGQVDFVGEGALPSAFAVTDFAAAAVATAGLAIAERLDGRKVVVDRRLASMWFQLSLRPVGWKLPPLWDPIAGDYQCRDGWLRLHTNAPHHRRAAERVLGAHADRESLARVVAGWEKSKLE